MATQQKKKRFSLISPNASSLLSNYFSTSPVRDEKFPTQDDVRKAVENLERIVLAANDYCDSIDKLSKASKTFSKSLRDYGNTKGMDTSHVICFQATSQFYESHAEVQSKLNKLIQKEFETLQKFWDKYSKKVTKEEKAHSDYIDDLDRQLNKITMDYEKKIKKDSKSSAESYEKHMNSVATINSDITRARREYVTQVSKRERNTHDVIAQIICRIIGNQNNSFDDSKKKGDPSITKINETLPLLGACTQASQDDNEDSSIISKPAKEIAMITRKLSRRASHKVSQSIASISELQLAAMNYLSPDPSKPLSKEQEYFLSLKSSPPPQIPVLISPEPIDIEFNRSISMVSEEMATFEIDRPKESGDLKGDSPVSLIQNFDTPSQPSLSLPVTVKTPDLVSKISIGIHEDDKPFFRDYDVDFSSNGDNGVTNDKKDSSNDFQSPEKQQGDIKNKRLSVTIGNGFSNDNTSVSRRETDQSKEETKQDSNNEKLNPAYSFDTRNNFDSERVEIERKVEPKKREHLQHIFSQSDGNIRYEGKFIDEPTNEILCHSPISTNNEDVDKQNSKSQRFDNHNSTSSSPLSSPLSIKSNASESEKPRTRTAYNLNPRRAYTDYSLPINTNKRAGPSVADLRERLLSLSNDKEKTPPTTPRSIPISRQGHVITLLSKFDAEGSNCRQSQRSSSNSKSDDYFYRSQDSRSSDYNYNDRHYDDEVDRNNSEFKDEMYVDHTQDEHVLSSSPSKQEECDCHICQQITEKMNPQDDSSTFGRRSFCENNSNS